MADVLLFARCLWKVGCLTGLIFTPFILSYEPIVAILDAEPDQLAGD